MMNREIPLTLTTDQISFVLELLNNERYTSNTHCTLAEHTIARIVSQESVALIADAEEDAYWDAREAALNDEHIDAECAARALGY